MRATSRSELEQLLEELTAATRLLRRADDVPLEIEQLVTHLDATLHADAPLRLEVDPYLSTTLFAGALRAMKALRHDDTAEKKRDLRVALEQLRHTLRDVLEDAPVAADVPIREVLVELSRSVNVPQKDLAGLLGVSTRQLQRWLAPDGSVPGAADEARIRIVAQLGNHLRHVFTPPGVPAWFRRPHPHLGRPPIELLDDPSSYPELRELAAASRSMTG